MTVLFCFYFFPDAPTTEQQELFTQKLQQCCTVFDFIDSVADLKSKEVKRATLNELVDYVSTNRGVLVEAAYPEIINMVRISFIARLCSISLSKSLWFLQRNQGKTQNGVCKIQRGLSCESITFCAFQQDYKSVYCQQYVRNMLTALPFILHLFEAHRAKL